MKIKWLLSAWLMLALSGVCVAADFDAKIVNLDGSMPTDEKGKTIEITVRTVVLNSLMAPSSQDEANLSGEEKIRRIELARRISKKDASSQVFSSEDIALIKKLVNRNNGSPLVVEQTWRALESNKK